MQGADKEVAWFSSSFWQFQGVGFLSQISKESIKSVGTEQPESVFKGSGQWRGAGTGTWVEEGA